MIDSHVLWGYGLYVGLLHVGGNAGKRGLCTRLSLDLYKISLRIMEGDSVKDRK